MINCNRPFGVFFKTLPTGHGAEAGNLIWEPS
jgi:hypothetical protein